MLKKFNSDFPIIVSNFSRHNEVKSQLLHLIEKESFSNTSNQFDQISATDFFVKDNMKYEYYQFIKPLIAEHMTEVFREFDVQGFAIGNMWAQQYNFNDTHHWHLHGSCHFTNVYFIELPNNELTTEIKSLDGSLLQYSAVEGSIITFPSFLYHRSPKNKTKERKTVISFNMNLLS